MTCGRLLLQPSQRRRFVRELHIRRAQNSLIAKQYNPEGAKLIVYIVDGADWITGKERISGGLLSIASMFEEAKKLPELASYQFIMVTLNSIPLILRHTQFENNITVFRLSQVFSYFNNLQHLIINVPELLVPALPAELGAGPRRRLEKIKNFHINILNQNILIMPGPESVDALKHIAKNVTMTTAHVRYCTEALSRQYKVSMHNLSVFGSPERYRRCAYAEKENLMIASPDQQPMSATILEGVQARLPSLRIQVIKNLTYGDYKATIERAKWAITFGEGLDFYFIETVFSGGISFAVYNDDFFPKEFTELPAVFSTYEHMCRELPAMIEHLDNPINFNECQKAQFNLCRKHYQYDRYLRNLSAFYRGDYDVKFHGGS